MGQSLSKVYLHLVFSTKDRDPLITSQIERSLHSYIASICKNLGCFIYAINGTENHVHILLEQSRTITISKLLESIKSNSSRWIKSHSTELKNFAWQSGYGVFSVGQATLESAKKYIANQKSHHKKCDFKEELMTLLERAQITYDENYLWD